MRSYALKSTVVMLTIDFSFMAVLCYVLGLHLGLIPVEAWAYWKLAGLCYLGKTAVWFGLRIPLLLPIDRWIKRGMPPEDNDPGLVRGIYFFPYDFSIFYGVLIFSYYVVLIGLLVRGWGDVKLSSEVLLPGILYGLAVATGAVAIGVPVNLLLTSKFSRRLSERRADSFSQIPGKMVSLRKKMATVAVALGCAPSLLLFSITYFLQFDATHQEAERTAEMVAHRLVLRSQVDLESWRLPNIFPFSEKNGELYFLENHRPPVESMDSLSVHAKDMTSRPLLEKRLGYVLRYSPGTKMRLGVVVAIPEPRNDYIALSLVVLLACLWPLVTSLLTVQTIVRPVEVIASLFHRIVGRGRIEADDRVPISYKDEVGRLAFNANRTLEMLARARWELEQSAEHLAEKNRELQEAYRTKGEFLANMSHELRTPLNAIIGFSRLMKRKLGDTLPERQQKNLDLIKESGEQLMILVNDLLDFEKIEAGKLTIRRETMDIGGFLESLRGQLEPLATDKGLTLDFQLDNLPSEITSDRERLRQIVTNLLTNAIKYSDRGTVTLGASCRENRLHLVVRDQGIGMSEGQIERIFDPFHQVDGSETRERGGVGLGLAIVGRLVTLLQGTISVTSAPGEGSVFTVTLPTDFEAQHLQATGSGTEILVVDDSLKDLDRMHGELTGAGFRVHVATSATRALELLEDLQPSAILLDIVMPEMDGWELLGRIRENSDWSEIPVIVTSAINEKPVGIDLDIQGWATKPIELDKIRPFLENATRLTQNGNGPLLIVEDDPHTAQLLKQAFAEEGVETILAATESEARQQISDTLPAVLVLDLNLAKGSGWDVLAYLRTLARHEQVKVFVYTAGDLNQEERDRLNERFVTIVKKHGADSLSALVTSVTRQKQS